MHFMDMPAPVMDASSANTSTDMPPSMRLNFLLNDTEVILNLVRNTHVAHDVPFYTGPAADLRVINGSDDVFGVYHDVDMKASILLRKRPQADVDNSTDVAHECVSKNKLMTSCDRCSKT